MGFGFQPGGGTRPGRLGAVDDVDGAADVAESSAAQSSALVAASAADGGGSGGVGTLLASDSAGFAEL